MINESIDNADQHFDLHTSWDGVSIYILIRKNPHMIPSIM